MAVDHLVFMVLMNFYVTRSSFSIYDNRKKKTKLSLGDRDSACLNLRYIQ